MASDTETQVDIPDAVDIPADSEGTSGAEELVAAEAPPATDQSPQAKLSRILSMKVPVIVKIAQKKMTVSDILKLRLGSVIQFEKDPYQNIDLMVNNSPVGAGQPVKVNENFGLKIVQIGNITDTIKSLGGGENA